METIEPNKSTNPPSISEGESELTGLRQPVVPTEFDRRSSTNLHSVYNQIVSLCRPETEDDDLVPPTRRAVERTFHILEEIVNSLMASNDRFPEGFVTTDDRGGVRIEWWHERSRCVTLMIDASDDSKDYVFERLDDGKGSMNRPVLPQKIAEQLTIISQL